jgi:molybdenum cofactor biosynthesis protein B
LLTISDSRTLDNDRGGDELQRMVLGAGHGVWQRLICPDDPEPIRARVQTWTAQEEVDVILLTGGTGISRRDQTFETIRSLLTKELPGYGELFRWLSYQEIGAAAMLSRAIGGLIDTTVVLTMPGSPAAVQLAMQRVILPELGHLVQQARK